MNKSNIEENKSRWMLFEQVSPMSSAIVWAVFAIIVALGALYVLT